MNGGNEIMTLPKDTTLQDPKEDNVLRCLLFVSHL